MIKNIEHILHLGIGYCESLAENVAVVGLDH